MSESDKYGDGKSTITTKSELSKQYWDERASVENERIRQWNVKHAREAIPLSYKQERDTETGNANLSLAGVNHTHTTIQDHAALHRSILCSAFGTASAEYSSQMLGQTLNAQFISSTIAPDRAKTTIEALISMEPKDVIEGQICSRLIVLTDQYNEYMRRAAIDDQSIEARERYVNMATKLMRMHNETLEALNKYRRKGEQRVTVQHINVNDGGKAVVAAQFNTSEGVLAKK